MTYATNIDAENLHTKYKGFKSRANLTWHIMPDALVYYTWSQGFRPGAFNRNSACYIPDAKGTPLYCSPLAFTSDNLTNNEIGWKTEFFDHRLQWNGAVYQEDWNNVQVNFFDPGVLGNVGFGTNGPNYRVRGLETSIIAVLAPGADGAGRCVLEQQQADQLALPDREQSRSAAGSGDQGGIRTAHPQRCRIRTVRPAVPRPIRRRCSSTCVCGTSGQ